MTALRDALKKAGVKSADERLTDITLAAMIEHADNTFAACEQIWREIQKDRGLMIELFKFGWRREVSGLLARVRSQIRSQVSNGKPMRDIDRKAAKAEALISKEERRLEAEDRAEDERAQAEADRKHQEHLAAWRATAIGNIEIGGTPVWQVTPGTARVWIDAQKRRWKTVELLIEGLPEDGHPIEYYRRPKEVAELWKRSA